MIAVYGAGSKGQMIALKFRNDEVKYYVDKDINKIGKYIHGIEVKSISDYLSDVDNVTLVTTVFDREIFDLPTKKSGDGSCIWFENYFEQQHVIEMIDEDLYSTFKFDFAIRNSLFFEETDNWYRSDFYNELNKKLIHSFQLNNMESIECILNAIYNNGGVLFDEYYEKRPGLRLARRIINEEKEKLKVIDLACGHGELIRKLAEDGHETYAVDQAKDRIDFLKRFGVTASVGNMENTSFQDAFFDVVIATECLEHVADVIVARDEIERILKIRGIAIVSVPYGKYCDCSTHVRQFDEVKLASLFYKKFELINIIKTPAVNEGGNEHLFMVCKKISN